MIIVLLVAHFVGDFVCQTDAMATRKSHEWGALARHVAAYTLVLTTGVLAATVWGAGLFTLLELPLIALFLVVNAATHLVQDAITSRINARLWFFRRQVGIFVEAPWCRPHRGIELVNPWLPDVGNRHWFFVAIGADQLLHYVTLFVTAHWWL